MDDKTWFTYKARIQAHIRLCWLEVHSQLLLIWYAILSAALAVVAIRYPHVLGRDTDVLAAVLSIALLGISLAVANRDFRGRSIAMQRNYLELQRLHDQAMAGGSFGTSDLTRYHDLLAAVENHREIDDKLFRVLHANTLTTRHPTLAEKLNVYGYLALRIVVTFLLYLAPIAIMLWYAT